MSQSPSTNDPLSHVPLAPPALQPAYPVGGLNCVIVLYEGELEVEQGSNLLRAPGTIQFEWFPSPRITFGLGESSAQVFFDLHADAALRLSDGRVVPRARITHARMTNQEGRFSQIPSGRVDSPVSQETVSPFSYLTFLIPNFHDMIGEPIRFPHGVLCVGRIEVRACGWRLAIDPIDHPRELHQELERQSGYIITHVGRLEREDGSTFTEEQAGSILQGLGWYLSFTAGRWTGPLLACGYDSSDTRVRELWNVPRLVPWRFVQTWVDDRHLEHLTSSFTGYIERWSDQDWNEVIEVATHWYIEANAQAGSIEGALVLTQTAFEMLASAIVVEENGWVSADAFEHLPAADRIRLLFVWAGVPLAIPPSLPDLTALARGRNWADAPQAITQIRNPLTHPTPRNRERFRNYPLAARSQAWNLGLWLLELCLLRLCGYNGTHGCRLATRYAGDVEPVPWAPRTTAPGSMS